VHASEAGYNFQPGFVVTLLISLTFLLGGLLCANQGFVKGGSNVVTLVVVAGGLGMTAWEIMQNIPGAADTPPMGQALVVGLCCLIPVFVWLVMHNCATSMRKGNSLMVQILDLKFTTIAVLVSLQLTTMIGGGFWYSQLGNNSLFGASWALLLSIVVFISLAIQDAGDGGFFHTTAQRKAMAWTASLTTLCFCGFLFTGGFGNWGSVPIVLAIALFIVPGLISCYGKNCSLGSTTNVYVLGSMLLPGAILAALALPPMVTAGKLTVVTYHLLVIPVGILGLGFFIQWFFDAVLNRNCFNCWGNGKYFCGTIQGR